ncbi:WD40 repeat [Lecanosticta acicola]|uniref:WD40 repeat n=1 Tax=Lecanosticta acicola TaxID=111012 RepID=A0AAI8YU79_9PEZI|nr:WD40 repeat [Lecanosticta acicola]
MSSDHHHHHHHHHQPNEETSSLRCVASTQDAFKRPVDRRLRPPSLLTHHEHVAKRSNVFHEAQLSPDGSAIITNNEDQCLRTYPLSADVLDENEEPRLLRPHDMHLSHSNIQAFAIYPHFNAGDTTSTLILCGSTDVPITLRNALALERPAASYPFVTRTTEEHCPPRSLAFTRDGNHFVAGSDNYLAIFDCYRDGEPPVSFRKLRSRRAAVQLDSSSFSRSAIIRALDISSGRTLAVGSFAGEVGLFGNEGNGACDMVFRIREASGSGVSSLKWSPDGKYLLVAGRKRDDIFVYDIRNTMSKVSTLTGRRAETLQRLGVDVLQTEHGYELWAGGTDGCVRKWENPGLAGGDQAPDAEMRLHDGPVSSATWHSSGAVMVTCSGELYPSPNLDDSDEESGSDDEPREDELFVPDNSLKVWAA